MIFISILLYGNVLLCFPPSDDYYNLEPRIAVNVHCKNQLELLETTFQLLESIFIALTSLTPAGISKQLIFSTSRKRQLLSAPAGLCISLEYWVFIYENG